MMDSRAQNADQGLDAGVGVDVGQVWLHDVTGSQPGATEKSKGDAGMLLGAGVQSHASTGQGWSHAEVCQAE